MPQVRKIACINNAGFVMSFSIRWQSSDKNWNTTNWNSGTYPIGQSRTSPDLETIGVDAQAIAITPYVYAVLGDKKDGTPSVMYQPNDQIATYQVKGTTLNYSVCLIT